MKKSIISLSLLLASSAAFAEDTININDLALHYNIQRVRQIPKVIELVDYMCSTKEAVPLGNGDECFYQAYQFIMNKTYIEAEAIIKEHQKYKSYQPK